MARCRCSSENCTCLVSAGSGITIAGAGSPGDPWVISAASGGAYALTVGDTADINLVLSGLGTTASPHVITAFFVETDGYAPLRRALKTTSASAYTPILTDETQMVSLGSSAATTVTLPADSAVAFPISSEVDFLWFGTGQPTFVAGAGATVNGTPGLKLRARYAAATAKKVAANAWVVIGDLAV